MFNLGSAEFLMGLITIFLAYIASETIAGAFRAWVAFKVGDDTAKEAGFMSLNPLVHIDPIGTLFLLFFYIGWGRRSPINPYNIMGKWRTLRLSVAYFSTVFIRLLGALVALLILLMMLDINILAIARYMVVYGQLSPLAIARIYPTYSSVVVSIALVLIDFIYLNIVLAVLDFLIEGCRLVMFFVTERSPQYAANAEFIILVTSIVVILLFWSILRTIAGVLITHAGYVLAQAIGILG